jgi:hypothetical protein
MLSPERAFDLSGTSNSTPLYAERVKPPPRECEDDESAFSSAIRATGMERLWSRAGATSGNWWQMSRPRNRLKW